MSKKNLILIFMATLIWGGLAYSKVDPGELSKGVAARFNKVPEFKFIQEEADKLGVKVYLFGGTASAFAHYVRWDLEREAGDDKYQEERFDYDFTNIYRGNQDLDIVVDGTAEEADKLQGILRKKYPHFVGDKDAWEVRLLRKAKGDKLPLLNDFDFLNQHTDTNSTGLLALTAKKDEIVFRDIFDWDSRDSNFLKDVANARIKFIFSDTHSETSRFKDGKNPPVFAAIRYLAKLAQYEVTGFEGDLAVIKKIVKEANWKEIKDNPYVKHKLEEFGKKVLLNAPDSEYAWNLLDKTGLREKLIKMDGNQINSQDSLSWWMNKEPLRSSKIGKGDGNTAKELFKDQLDENGDIVVSHETNSFRAYDNITRSSKGMANAFISRDGVSGEMAAYGDGFYTQLGVTGARGTNLTIRFVLHPDAREGHDFIREGDFIVVKNKKALRLIQENLNLSLTNFLKLMISGGLKINDQGSIEKFKRKFSRINIDSQEFKDAIKFFKTSFFLTEEVNIIDDINFDEDAFSSFDNFFNTFMERAEYFEKFIKEKLPKMNPKEIEALVEPLISQTFHSGKGLTFLNYLGESLDDGDGKTQYPLDLLLIKYIPASVWNDRPELIKIFMNKGDAVLERAVLAQILSQPGGEKNPDLVNLFIDQNKNISYLFPSFEDLLIEHILKKPHWNKHPEFIRILYDQNSSYIKQKVVEHVLSQPHWKDQMDLVFHALSNEYSITGDEFKFNVAHQLFKPAHRKNDVDFLIAIVDGAKGYTGKATSAIIKQTLNFDLKTQPSLVKALVDSPAFTNFVIKNIFSDPFWKGHPEWLRQYINQEYRLSATRQHMLSQMVQHALSKSHWGDFPDLLETIIKEGNNSTFGGGVGTLDAVLQFALNRPHWKKYPYLVEAFLEKTKWHRRNSTYESYGRDLLKLILADSERSPPIEWLLEVIGDTQALHDKNKESYNRPSQAKEREEVNKVLSLGHWQNNKKLEAYLEGKSLSFENIISRMKVISFKKWMKKNKKAFKDQPNSPNQYTCKSIL